MSRGHVLCDIEAKREAILSSIKMQVRVDVDDHIDGSEELMVRVEGVVEGSLDRFQGRIARVDVHLGQLGRSGISHHHLCCRMEAYAGALTPIVVSHESITLTEAIHAAAVKLNRAVALVLGQRGRVDDATGVEAPEGGSAAGEGLGHLRSS
jgi:hypothetical protein